jgi:hypothetical protein
MIAQPQREIFLRGQLAARVLAPLGKGVLVLGELQIRDHFVDHAIAEDHVDQGRHELLPLLRIGRAKRTGDRLGCIDVDQDLRGRHVFSRHQQAADQRGCRGQSEHAHDDSPSGAQDEKQPLDRHSFFLF